MKNPLTLAGIEPATFRFVAQHHDQYLAKITNLIQLCASVQTLLVLLRHIVTCRACVCVVHCAKKYTKIEVTFKVDGFTSVTNNENVKALLSQGKVYNKINNFRCNSNNKTEITKSLKGKTSSCFGHRVINKRPAA